MQDQTDDGWEHRITVPANKAAAARTLAENWLSVTNIDATVD